ncbi:MAG: VOC family protein [Halorientalis sp.]
MSDDALPPSTRVGRVALTVADLPETVAFYRDVVGLAVHAESDAAARLGDGETDLLVLRADPSAPPRPPASAGLFHLAVRVPSRAALADVLARVEASAGTLAGASDHGVSEALYLADPEGNGVEVYRDRPRSAWPTSEGRVEMTTDPLDLGDLAAEGTGAASVPAGTDVGHVHLEVTDLAAAREFYVDTLGLGVRQAWGGQALFLAAGDYHHHVGLNTWNGRTDPASGRGLAWFELVVPDDALGILGDRWGDEVTRQNGAVEMEDPDGIAIRVRGE